jgi:hypothetical protein
VASRRAPVASAIGFGVIGFTPLLFVLVLFTVVRRVGEYALAKPAREVLFTEVSREEKYEEGMEPDDLLCSHNARPGKALVGRAQRKINQPPSLKKEQANLE